MIYVINIIHWLTNLQQALLNRFKEGSWGNYVAKFSAAERLQNWLLEKREGCKDENKNDSKAIWVRVHDKKFYVSINQSMILVVNKIEIKRRK